MNEATAIKPATELRELDGFRAIAVIMVVNFHVGIYVNWIPGFNSIIRSGSLGVQLFFILSAFLLSRQFLLSYHNQNKKEFIVRYFKRRFLRIYPLFFISSIILLLVGYKAVEMNLKSGLGYFLFIDDIQINPVVWSLFVEVKYYLCLPIIMLVINKMLQRKNLTWVLVLLGCMAFVGIGYRAMEFYSMVNGSFSTAMAIKNLDCLGWGILAAVLYEKGKLEQQNYQWLYGVLSASVILIIAMMLGSKENIYTPVFKAIFLEPIFNIAWASAILCVLLIQKGFVNKLLSSKFMLQISILSYSIYIWHVPIRAYIHQLISTNLFKIGTPQFYISRFIVCWAIIVIFSMVSYRFFEKPFLYKKRVIA